MTTTNSSRAESPSERLHTLAAQIREVYILCYRDFKERQTNTPCDYGCKPIPRWDGGVDASGRRHKKNVWYDLARFAIDRQVEPAVLVRATFDAFIEAGAKDPPFPPTLIGADAIRRLDDYARRREDDTRQSLALQNNTFATEVVIHQEVYRETIEQAGTRVLNDPRVELSALYRYCLATRGGLTDVAARFARAAFAQYLFNRAAYNTTWDDLIPRSLADAAETFHGDTSG